MSLRLTPRSNCSEVRKRAVSKLDEINKKIADLQRKLTLATDVMRYCLNADVGPHMIRSKLRAAIHEIEKGGSDAG